MSESKQVAGGVQEESETFIASATFQGAKPGYVFATDDAGTGYYKDVSFEERYKQAQQQAQQDAKSKPKVIQANNSLLKSLQKRGPVTIPSLAAKKAKTDAGKKEAVPAYLREMERYKSMSCASDTKHDRPLVK